MIRAQRHELIEGVVQSGVHPLQALLRIIEAHLLEVGVEVNLAVPRIRLRNRQSARQVAHIVAYFVVVRLACVVHRHWRWGPVQAMVRRDSANGKLPLFKDALLVTRKLHWRVEPVVKRLRGLVRHGLLLHLLIVLIATVGLELELELIRAR